MSYNLTITIPDDLWEKIQRWRDRMAIAKTCQTALAAEVAKFEELPKDLAEMESVVKRLRRQKTAFEQKSYKIGFKQGTQWAKKASYTDLGIKAQLASERDLTEWILGEDVVLDEKYDLADELSFQRGWLDAVAQFWELMERKL